MISALLQITAAASLGAEGLEALAVHSSNAKREAFPQTTASVCLPNTSCVPDPTDWSISSEPNGSYPTTLPTTPRPGSWTKADPLYFLGAYVPTLAAILFSIWWKCVSARLKEMKPYYQLNRTSGAEAKDSLLLSYSTVMLPVVLVRSFRSKHWLTFNGTVIIALITVCTLFAAATLHLKGVGEGCGIVVEAKGDSNEDCKMQLTMQPVLGFLLGVVLLTVVSATLLLLRQLSHCRSGLFAEATSIVCIACLSNSISVQKPLQSARLSLLRFMMRPPIATGATPIVETTPLTLEVLSGLLDACRNTDTRGRRHEPREMHLTSLALFLCYQAATLFLVVYYSFVTEPGTGNVLEDFMGSQSFGTRLLMTAIGLGIKFYWSWIERYVRRMSPFVDIASPKGSTAQKSILLASPSHPITALIKRST